MFWIEYKNASFYSSDTSFEVHKDNSKSTLTTPSSTSSDEQQKKVDVVTKFQRQSGEKTPPPAEPAKDCTGSAVMALPAPKQGVA